MKSVLVLLTLLVSSGFTSAVHSSGAAASPFISDGSADGHRIAWGPSISADGHQIAWGPSISADGHQIASGPSISADGQQIALGPSISADGTTAA